MQNFRDFLDTAEYPTPRAKSIYSFQPGDSVFFFPHSKMERLMAPRILVRIFFTKTKKNGAQIIVKKADIPKEILQT